MRDCCSSGFAHELRIASRVLARSPVSSLLAVVTLGLGIGGSTAFFALLDAAFLRPLPFPEMPRLVRLLDALPTGAGGSYLGNPVPSEVEFLERRARTLDRLTAQRFESFALLGAGDPVQVGGASLSSGSAELLGLHPILGRLFDAREDALGEASGVVLVSHSLWRDRFGSDPGVIGRSLRLGDREVTVVGVAPPGFHFPYRADVWQPLRIDPQDRRDLLVIGRLRPAATVRDAQTEMTALAADFRHETGIDLRSPRSTVRAIPLREELLRDQETTSIGLFLATGLFLVMACANVAGLLAVRASMRWREAAVRSALGASPAAQVRQALAEPALLAAAGAAVALAVLRLAAPALQAMMPQVLAEELGVRSVHLDARVGAFAALASLAAGALTALAPLHAISKTSATAALGAGRTPRLAGRQRGLRALVAAEIGLLSLLLVASSALVAGFLATAGAPLGFEPRGVRALRIVAPTSRYDDPSKLARLVERIADEAATSPRARVAISTIQPVSGGTWGDSVRLPGAPPESATEVNLRLVSPGFFATLGIPLSSGRDFVAADAVARPVAVVSRRLARRLWKRDDVVGESLARGGAGSPVVTSVIGVADDVADAGELRETLYLPFAQQSAVAGANEFWVMARDPSGGESWVRELENAIRKIDPQLAWSDTGWMDAMRSRSLERGRLGSRLAALYSVFGLLLAGLGLGGVMAFLLARREAELGVRQALGATPGHLLRALSAEGLALAGSGLAAGFGAFFVLRPALAHWVPDLADPSLGVLAVVAGLILSVSALAAYLPARRAARRDPVAALREI